MAEKLDDLKYIKALDRSDMLGLLIDLPGQIEKAMAIAKDARPKVDIASISNVVFAGVGGSAIGGDVIKCCLADELNIPFVVNRDYFVTEFINSKTLFFASSYSGNTEETIGAYKDAKKKGAKVIVITGGGILEKMAKEDNYPVVKIPGGMPPRCAIGYSFVPPLVILSKIGLIKDKAEDIEEAIKVIAGLRDKSLGPNIASKNNPAKKIASVLEGRYCAIYGWSRNIDCTITRFRNQLNENSKAFATSHFFPELNHNEIMGFTHPKKILKDTVVVFFRDKDDYARINDRIEITSSVIKSRVHKIMEVRSKGEGLIARICSLIYIGDFISFYLAILNKEDPTPVDEIVYLKNELSKRKNI